MEVNISRVIAYTVSQLKNGCEFARAGKHKFRQVQDLVS